MSWKAFWRGDTTGRYVPKKKPKKKEKNKKRIIRIIYLMTETPRYEYVKSESPDCRWS